LPPPELELAPIADTHVDRESGADWDHGASERLHIDATPGAIGYLKFDLRAAVVPVRTATLSLHCANASSNGGAIHPVLDSMWIEGSGLGNSAASEEGSGLKWIDVDTNGDGAINAKDDSPYVPGFATPIAAVGPVRVGETVVLDVTAAVQAGPGIYSFAIVGKSAGGVEYSTREHPDARLRPVLRVELELACRDDADCDDGVFCNGGEVCTPDGCRKGAARPNGTECADANVCNGLERCKDGMCTAGVPLQCDDGAVCTLDGCDAALGCRQVPVPDGTACPDASVCNGRETCQAGVCTPGTPLECDDGNPCTTDACHPAVGCQRVAVASGTGCGDGTVCNGSERCQLGVCTAGPALECDDGNPCTTDSCDPVAGCRNAYVSGRCGPVVRDPVADTYIEAGVQSSWDHGAADHLDVDDRPRDVAYLKFDLRDVTGPVEAASLWLRCVNRAGSGGVVYPVLDSSWVEGTRTGVDGASAGGPGLKWRTVDTNGDGRVSPADGSPYVPDFTQPLATLGAVEIGQPVSVDLTAAFQNGAGLYTIAIVGEVTDGSGFASREAAANDRPRLELRLASSLPCTADAECDDGLVCTTDTCRPVAGCQHAPAPDGSTCADGDACNGAETCQAGACVAGIPLDCADGNACTTDGCDALAGCRHLAVPDGTACPDATVCNGLESCVAGVCVPGAALDCDEGSPCTTDACDAVAGCQRLSMADGTSCADGDLCNGDETCLGGECTGGPPRNCDDGDACTTDECDASAGCRHDFVCSSITLGPVADTYIEEGVEAAWDHGAAGHMDSDLRPRGIIYLKFDLSAIKAPVAGAALMLHCTNASPDGGTVYPVAHSTWVEGAGNGIDASSRSGNGLKWIDVDTNGDRSVDGADASPYVPDFAHPIATIGPIGRWAQVTVDVTAAFQDGPGVYTLAIRNDVSDGITFASREYINQIRRPALTLTFSRP
jgi:hypothetical protein